MNNYYNTKPAKGEREMNPIETLNQLWHTRTGEFDFLALAPRFYVSDDALEVFVTRHKGIRIIISAGDMYQFQIFRCQGRSSTPTCYGGLSDELFFDQLYKFIARELKNAP